MASVTGRTHLSLLSLLTLLIISHAKNITLDPSDHEALLTVLTNLGLKKQDINKNNLCNINGVLCERRISDNSYNLRVTRILLDSCHLSGFLSPDIGRLCELREISLANNQLVDGIPPHIVDCRKMEILNLQNNKFSGEVPLEISSLARLRVLDLSSNGFSGEVPFSIGSFRRLQFFDISGNNFDQNDFPRRNMLAGIKSTTVGNSTKSSGKGRNTSFVYAPAPAPTSTQDEGKHKKNIGMMILGFIVGAIAGTSTGIIFSLIGKLLLILFTREYKPSGVAIFSSLIKKAADLDFLKKDDVLSTLEVIGEGGCGKVFKAQLPGNEGRIIAIKKIIQPLGDAAELSDEDSKLLTKKMRQIKSEIRTVGQIRHRNLLPLLAHVARPDCHYLIYEFMKNGSLQDLLTAVSQGTRQLDWLARYKIALGVASGIEYLHFNHTPHIIHRDLKPGNILLDDDMEARISDFGLAKSVPDDYTHISTSNVVGTLGYIAPEYHQTSKFTEMCDMYSFGVILGVLVMGKLPSDMFFQRTNEMSLVKWMRNVMISEEPKRAIDPDLMGNGYEEQMLLVLKIACFCSRNDPKQRPNSKEVRSMLSQIKHEEPRGAE